MRERLAEFDGKATSILGEAEAALAAAPGYRDALITLAAARDANVSSGATWLLKSALENGAVLSDANIAVLSKRLPEISAWQAQLHVCQCVRLMSVPPSHASAFATWLDPLLSHQRPFLRAWSLDALYRLSRQHSGYGPAFADALARAERDDAASVRARARKLV